MDRPRRRGFVVLLAVALVSGLAMPVTAVGQAAQTQPDADNTVTRVQVFENGSARWSIQVRTRLETADEVDQYRAFQARIEASDASALERFRTRITGVVEAAANATDREMVARRFALSTHIQEVPQRWGVVTYEFTWTAFAAADGDALDVGDVFEGGFFLAENDRLIVAAPDGYRVAASDPRPDATLENGIAWDGRRDFPDGQPRVRFEPERSATGPTETAFPTTAPPGTSGTGQGWVGMSAATLTLLVVVGLGVLGGSVLAARRLGWLRLRGTDAAGDLETDADRVRAMLAEHGGQLKQAEIDDAVEWSASKTSRVLSRMAEEGSVEKLRIGRENVIRLPDDGAEEG